MEQLEEGRVKKWWCSLEWEGRCCLCFLSLWVLRIFIRWRCWWFLEAICIFSHGFHDSDSSNAISWMKSSEIWPWNCFYYFLHFSYLAFNMWAMMYGYFKIGNVLCYIVFDMILFMRKIRISLVYSWHVSAVYMRYLNIICHILNGAKLVLEIEQPKRNSNFWMAFNFRSEIHHACHLTMANTVHI